MYRKNLSFFSRNFEIVGNKTEMRISNWVFQENKAHQIFQKKEHFLPPVTHKYSCVSRGKNVRFSEIWHVLFSWNTRFEIRPFALLPTKC